MLEATLRRDRFVIAAGLAALSGLAWVSVARMAAMPARDMSTMAMPPSNVGATPFAI